MDLFDFNNNEETAKPLAERMRANALDDFIGQKHIVAEGSLLRRAIAIASAGNDRAVVWTPGTNYTLPDFDEDSWRRFVCVETVSDWPGGRTLEPGGKYTLLAAIQSTMEGCDEEA